MANTRLERDLRIKNKLSTDYYERYFKSNNSPTWAYINKSIPEFINSLDIENCGSSQNVYSAIINTLKKINTIPETYLAGISEFCRGCINNKIINDDIEQLQKSLIKEAVNHFCHKTIAALDDDARYFYNKEEFNDFINLYRQKSGDPELKNIHAGIIYDDHYNTFECYEVVHRTMWDKYRYMCEATKDWKGVM